MKCQFTCAWHRATGRKKKMVGTKLCDEPLSALWEEYRINLFDRNLWGLVQRYTYRVLQTIQMKLILLCVMAERAVLGIAKNGFKIQIWNSNRLTHIQCIGQGISLKNETKKKHDLNVIAHKINCVCHSIRSMFRVLGMYNFGLVRKVLKLSGGPVTAERWWRSNLT